MRNARIARSWPMSPPIGSMSAVDWNGMLVGSQRHRSLSGGKLLYVFFGGVVLLCKGCPILLELISSKPMEGRYSSTARRLLPMHFGRFVSKRLTRSWRVQIEQTQRHRNDDRPQDDSEQPKRTQASQHADEDYQPSHLCASTDQPRTNYVVHRAHDQRTDQNQHDSSRDVPAHHQTYRRGYPDQSRADNRHQRKERHHHTPENRRP